MTVEPNDTEDDVARIVRNKDRPAAGSSWGNWGLLSRRENANVLPPFIPNSIQKTLRGAEQGSCPVGVGAAIQGRASEPTWGEETSV